jgi:hypothetical protein
MYYYVPVTDHLLNPEKTLPISKEVFAPLDGIPMFHSKTDAFFAALLAFSRHASFRSDNETLQHWLTSPTASPCSDQSAPKILLLMVTTSVEAGLAMPAKGADFISHRGWASIQGSPFRCVYATTLHNCRIECVQEGRLMSSPCKVSWSRVKMLGTILQSEEVSVLLPLEED